MAKNVERGNMTQTDAKGKVLRAPKDNADGNAQNFSWWKLGEAEMAGAIAQTVRFIERHQNQRLTQLTDFTQLYGNAPTYNLTGTLFARSKTATPSAGSSARFTFNLCASLIDTLTAKMAKNKVIPTYITNGGVWDVQRKAKKLTKFTQGLFYEQKVHEKSIEAFSDGGVWGDGFVYVFRSGDRVCIERVLPHELFVDIIESICTEPKQLHRRKIVDRNVAMELYPDLEEHIAQVNPVTYQEIGGYGTSADLIQMTESWHLRSGPGAKDGMKVMSVGDGVLIDDWNKDYFPFPHFRYSKRKLGWYGQGVCERQDSRQSAINRECMLIQQTLRMGSTFKVCLENGSKIVSQHINNDIGPIIHYTGTAPLFIAPPLVQPERYQWLNQLIMDGYKEEGVGQMSASAEKPMGVDSGKAMRTLTDIEDDRFSFVQQQMEAFPLEIARQALDVVKDIYKDKKSYEVVFPTTNFMETVDWKDIHLEDSQYVLKAYPTSELSEDIAGRLSEVQELMQAGLISPRTGRRLMEMPDIEMNENLSNAAEDRIHQMLEQMIDEREVIPLEPFNDLNLAAQLVIEYYNYCQYMNAPKEVLKVLQDFNALVKDAQGVTAPTALAGGTLVGPGMSPATGAPMVNPMPTPTSNLVPNVNTPGVA